MRKEYNIEANEVGNFMIWSPSLK